MSSKRKRSEEPKTKETKQQTAAARQAWRAHLVGKGVPDKIGGQPPPKAALSRRRAFGLRALER